MNALVCGYGSDSEQEEDSTTSASNRNDNGSVKSSEKGSVLAPFITGRRHYVFENYVLILNS